MDIKWNFNSKFIFIELQIRFLNLIYNTVV